MSASQEAGYNGIHFNQVAHSWVRDVRVLNSDSAFYSWGMVFCTISGLEVASGNRGYDNGHRGIWLERGQDNLIVGFNFTTMMYHDMSVSFYEHSTAFVNGTGKVSTHGDASTNTQLVDVLLFRRSKVQYAVSVMCGWLNGRR
jgi:hypothetical protein